MNLLSFILVDMEKIRLQRLFRFVLTLFFVFVEISLNSCTEKRAVSVLKDDTVFTLQYGNFEDELNVFDFSDIGSIRTSIAMRDGFFYIANGESKKIMELNSYGDLLKLYYNEENNLVPSFANNSSATDNTRKAISYPFNEITSLALDSKKCLYVVDRLPLERQEQDTEKRLVLGQIVLRFDDDGNFIDYLGQQGPGGTPFPYIKKIYVTNENELVVICTTTTGSVVYWFSTTGYLLYTIPIEKQNVPNPLSAEANDVWYEVENIVPDYKGRKLYLKVDYFSSHIDDASRIQSGITYEKSLLYALSVPEGTYSKPITIPPYTEQVASGFSTGNYDIPYDFLGVSDNGWFFFIVSTDSGFSLQMIQEDGQRVLKRNLDLNHKENLFYTFHLGNTGILSVLLVRDENATVNWWRTDSLIQAIGSL